MRSCGYELYSSSSEKHNVVKFYCAAVSIRNLAPDDTAGTSRSIVCATEHGSAAWMQQNPLLEWVSAGIRKCICKKQIRSSKLDLRKGI